MAWKPVLLVAAAQAVSAHFGLTYPAWRADTLSEAGEAKYSQWTYPCAGVPYKSGNVTEWPLDGGSLKLDLHHSWSYVFINLGLGDNATNFNISLTPQLLNTTGKGELCIDKLPVPTNIKDGAVGTIQVVTSGTSGSALYNCADIKFSKDAKPLGTCNSTVKSNVVGSTSSNSTSGGSGGSGGSGNNTKPTGDGKSAAGALGVNMAALGTTAGLAVAFALGLGL